MVESLPIINFLDYLIERLEWAKEEWDEDEEGW